MVTHFQAPLPLTLLDVADWVGGFSDFPIAQQLEILAPLNLPVLGQQQQLSFELGPSISLPRMLLRSADGRYTVQLQGDRFAFGWARIEPLGAPADYPGFEAMLAKWSEMTSRFEKWVEQRLRLRPQPRLVEVSYVNAALLEQGGRARRISEVFKFIQVSSSRPINFFNVNWAESVYPLNPDDGRFKGVVNAQVGLARALPATPVLAFNFAGIAEVATGQESKHIMNDIHAKIREMYQNAIASDAR